MNTTIQNRIKNDEILQKIISKFDNNIFLVGGSVRDFILDKNTHDRDIIVLDENARDFSLKISEYLNATFVPLDEENKIYRLVMPDKINYIDITNPIENSIEKDIFRRDLTMNAIAINLRTNEIVDFAGGLNDLNNKTINLISEKNFEDDSLRLLRVFRFQSIYGFEISTETFNAIKKYKELIKEIANERINYEILRLFEGKYADLAIENMDKSGLLTELFSFVSELKKVPPNTHHHLNLFNHSIETLRQIQLIYEKSPLKVQEHLNKIDFGGHSRLAHLKMAGFMHDIGKFSTWTIEENGRHRFIKHDDIGSKIAQKLLKEYHYSNKQIEYITTMIKYHIYPSSVMSADIISEKTMMRYIRRMEENSIDEIILAQADRLSARGPAITDEIITNNINSLNRLLNFYLEIKDTLKPLPKLIDGNEIMEILKIKPSKKLGEILDAIHEAQLNGEILTHEHAVDFVKAFK